MRPQPRALNPNPSPQAAAFMPPPSGAVTVTALAKETLNYWAHQRVAWLSGYKIKWVVPGREGAVSGSQSAWNLDVRIQPVEEIIPARTARYSLEPYVLVGGRPYVEPELGTRVTVKATVTVSTGTAVERSEAPTGLGETARWLPTPETYVDDVWSPYGGVPAAPDAGICWRAAEANAPTIFDEFTYARRGQWITTTSMLVQDSHYMRLEGMPMYAPGETGEPITWFFVAALTPPTKYWASLLRAVADDGSNPLGTTNLDLRLMPDGNLHPFTWGWQQPLPLIGESHALSLFGFMLNSVDSKLKIFTIDRNLQIAEMALYWPHSTTSRFVIGRNGESMYGLDLLDVLFFRGELDNDRIAEIANELDAAYGITSVLSQDQG